jgi:hypothetical protein
MEKSERLHRRVSDATTRARRFFQAGRVSAYNARRANRNYGTGFPVYAERMRGITGAASHA